MLAFLLCLGSPRGVAADDTDWTRFRGPAGQGVSEVAFPTEWTAADYEWQRDLPGRGHSSPVAFGQTLYVTTATNYGRRSLFALDLTTGDTQWERTIDLPSTHLHSKNSPASGSPAVDAERVYVPVASADRFLLVAYSHDGEPLWQADLGRFDSQHGPGSSPVVVGDLVIVPSYQLGPSRVFGIEATTGEIRWTSERGDRRAAYASAMPLPGRDDAVVLLSGSEGVVALDVESGRELVKTGEMPMRVVASPAFVPPPTFANGAVIITCGSGGSGKMMQAWELIPPGDGSSDWSAAKRWERTQVIPYVPTPLVSDGLLYLWNDGGVVCCVDPKDGRDIWRQRIGGKFTGSPIIAGDAIYCMSETGEVAVVATGQTFEAFGGGPLGEGSHATPVVAGDRLILRHFGGVASLKAR